MVYQRIFLIRNGERMDRMFPNWASFDGGANRKNNNRGFDGGSDDIPPGGNLYTPNDLNLPTTLPLPVPSVPASSGAEDGADGGSSTLSHLDYFKQDPPITEMGRIKSQLIGRGLRCKAVRTAHIYASPALRTVQTAASIADTFKSFTTNHQKSSKSNTVETESEERPKKEKHQAGPPTTVNIEPGLFDLLSAYTQAPAFLPEAHLTAFGYPINKGYRPVWPRLDFEQNSGETQQEFTKRVIDVTNKILKSGGEHEEEEDIVIVAHSLVIHTIRTYLQGRDGVNSNNDNSNTLKEDQMVELGLQYPYSSVVALEKRSSSSSSGSGLAAVWTPILNRNQLTITSFNHSTAVLGDHEESPLPFVM